MAFLATRPKPVDYQTSYPDSFVSVLIHGNTFQFMDNFVANDEQGGKQAATALTYSIANLLKHQGYPVMPLTTRILGNPEWLSHAYLDAGVIPNQVNYGWFLQGFNSVDSLVEFVPVEEGPSVPAYRARDLAGLLKVNLLDPHCKVVLYGGPIDDKVMQIVTENQGATENGRLIIVERAFVSNDLMRPLPSLQHIFLQGLFNPTEHRPLIAHPTPRIHRNIHNQRIDPPIQPLESQASWIRTQKFCNDYFLRGHCPDPRCRARHDGRLSAEQLMNLRWLARGLPCRHKNECRDPECYAGHMCPMVGCRGVNCRFWGDMHLVDKRIVAED